MPQLIFVTGAPATGKSWFIQQNCLERRFEVLDVSRYQRRAYEEAGFKDLVPLGAWARCLWKANALLLADILAALQRGRDVAVEHTLFRAKRRIAYLDEIRKLDDVAVDIYVMQPSDTLWRSNLEKRGLLDQYARCQRDAEEMEFPNAAEGFDRIFAVTDGVARLRMEPPRPGILGPARAELAEEAERFRREEEALAQRAALRESMKERRFWHFCEVCGKAAWITAREARDDGWRYPPHTGGFGLLGPRICGSCPLTDTLFWKVHTSGGMPIVCEGSLSPQELVTWRRIKGEPESLLRDEAPDGP